MGGVYVKSNKHPNMSNIDIGPGKYIKGAINSSRTDLYLNGTKTGTWYSRFVFNNLFSSGQKATAIFKYKILNWSGDLIFGRETGVLGFQLNMYVNGGAFGVWDANSRNWFTDGSAFGHTKNVVHELAFEVESNSYYKIWVDGVLKKHYTNRPSVPMNSLTFGDPDHALNIYINDILVTNKTRWLPNNYTVDLNNYWYDNICYNIMEKNNELYAIPN